MLIDSRFFIEVELTSSCDHLNILDLVLFHVLAHESIHFDRYDKVFN